MNAILIQARMSSTRFPGKMLHPLGSIPLVEYVYRRCSLSSQADHVCIITSTDESDDALYRLCLEREIPVCRGDLHNVLDRYVTCATAIHANTICRVCGDSPFVDITAIDEGFQRFRNRDELEYLYTTDTLNGFTSEIFTLNALQKIFTFPLCDADKEHVTKYMRDHQDLFKTEPLALHLRPPELAEYSLTIDYESDLKLAEKINAGLKGFYFKSNDIIDLLYLIKDNV